MIVVEFTTSLGIFTMGADATFFFAWAPLTPVQQQFVSFACLLSDTLDYAEGRHCK